MAIELKPQSTQTVSALRWRSKLKYGQLICNCRAAHNVRCIPTGGGGGRHGAIFSKMDLQNSSPMHFKGRQITVGLYIFFYTAMVKQTEEGRLHLHTHGRQDIFTAAHTHKHNTEREQCKYCLFSDRQFPSVIYLLYIHEDICSKYCLGHDHCLVTHTVMHR